MGRSVRETGTKSRSSAEFKCKKNNLGNEQDGNQLNNDFPELNVHDIVTRVNESPNPVPEFLTGRIQSRTHLNQSYEDINLDTTIPAHERIATAADPDPIT